MVRALWSCDSATAARFPVRSLARFFDNHGFLRLRGAPRWLTLPGGSRTYVDALLRAFHGKLRLGTAVRSLRRSPERVSLELADGVEHFDHAVIACHADQALGLLADPSDLERNTLAAFPYQSNETVLHTDERIMPRLKRTWSSWNVHLDDQGSEGACVTYWMNRLQPLDSTRNYFVTLNRSADLRPEHILLRQTYAHPVFTAEGIAAQARHGALIDQRRTSFAGAYWRNGFHEDGVASALRVVERLGSSSRPASEAA
jgi:predicted NAD/FAD-binding protein